MQTGKNLNWKSKKGDNNKSSYTCFKNVHLFALKVRGVASKYLFNFFNLL